MRVAFLTQDLQLSGGVGVIVTHAVQLLRQGFDVDLVLTRAADQPGWRYHAARDVPVVPLAAARERSYDVAVATWWETAHDLFELDAKRYACFVQSLEDRFYPLGDAHQHAAAVPQGLPVRFITEARWIADTLEVLHPGTKVLYVRNGITKDVFAPLERVPVSGAGRPLRILIEGSAHVPLKGVGDAVAAAGLMREGRHVTVVSGDGSAAGLDGIDRVAGPLAQRDLCRLYDETDVLLKLSRVEGMFGPPLEAFHRGATCVVTPVTGHEEYVAHLENGLVVDWDDLAGTARALDLLARDRALLHRLRTGALATARSWPSWAQQGQLMALALGAVVREPPPDLRPVGRRLARDAAAALSAAERRATELREAQQRVAEVERSRAYRLAVRGRTAVERTIRAPGRWRRRRRGELA